ncbi:MAG: hypothetical protein PF447_15270 [Spirochaetaceae bacterium]|jgi:hypothetical protein|nr:hypothetical protein [Spirochaetaceae bacterium]
MALMDITSCLKRRDGSKRSVKTVKTTNESNQILETYCLSTRINLSELNETQEKTIAPRK